MLDENEELTEAARATDPSETPETGTAEGSKQGDTAAPEGTDEAVAQAKKAPAKRTTKKAPAKKTAAKRTTKKAAAAPEQPGDTLFGETSAEPAPGSEAGTGGTGAGTPEGATPEGVAPEGGEPAAKRTAKKSTAKKSTAKKSTAKKSTAKKTAAKRTAKKAAAAPADTAAAEASTGAQAEAEVTGQTPSEAVSSSAPGEAAVESEQGAATATPPSATALLFQPPDPTQAVTTPRRRKSAKAEQTGEAAPDESAGEEKPQEKPAKKGGKKGSKKSPEAKAETAEEQPSEAEEGAQGGPEAGDEEQGGERRRRRRGGRRRRRSGGSDENESPETSESGEATEDKESTEDEGEEGAGTSRRRRRRRRGDGEGEEARARKPRTAEDEITALSGSTRLEAKKQRRREGREAGRRRAPIVSEAEFLARRESVERVMAIRQRKDLTQIAVLEDKVLVEHYVSRESQTSLIGNVYLGRVQNVLPSMEAAFIDIGKGRNAVLYAGEVNWDALGAKNGTPRKIEAVLKSGQSILVQVTKDPVGHKGARLTSQISIPGRFLVYVPDGTTSGISRKLPDTERNRLKNLLKEIVPESAGVIVRTAAEGASEEELTRDVERLTARWQDIEKKVKAGNAPQLLYGEPDLTLKVVRDLFTEDFKKLVIAGDDAWETVEGYVSHVAPDLADRLERYDGERDVFAEYRIDEQIEKALDRKVWLPSGGSLVIDRTEAMTVVDVNTGKFTGSGGNLEETVTKNNLEAAEEIVRQLRLRDIGGIIVIDFIDMVLESNRDLVLRRLVECLGRDRTRHQVAEVTSLGLVQMTRKRIGTGLLEAFSETCEHCQGRGLELHHEPIEPKKKGEDDSRRGRRGGRGRGRDQGGNGQPGGAVPSPKDFAAMARHDEKGEGGEAVETPAASDQAGEPEAESTPTGKEPRQRRAGRRKSAEKPAEKPGEQPAAEPATEAPAEGAEAAPAQVEELPPPGQPKVTVRSRTRGAGRAAAAPAGAGTTVEPAEPQGPQERPAQEAVVQGAEAAPEPTPEPPAPAPAVVTTVRRRSARRSAGPPAEAVGAATTADPSAQEPAGEPATRAADAEQASDEPADTDTVAPLVDAAELDGAAAASSEDEDFSGTPHVPVKRRGARRR